MNDRFHLGSDTKAMTALLGAMLVEDGNLRWSSTFGEVFPELGAKAVPGLRGATLEQFLSHTSDLPSDNEAFSALLGKAAVQEGNLDELRSWFVQQWSSTQPLASTPGTTFAYSNVGYTLGPAAELDRLGDAIAELSAHLDAATARLLDLICAFDARGAARTPGSALAPTGSAGG